MPTATVDTVIAYIHGVLRRPGRNRWRVTGQKNAEHRIDELRDEGLETRNGGFGEEQDGISGTKVLSGVHVDKVRLDSVGRCERL